ncbi:helix-turn-helix domain-containing protein [Gluconobacter oxydans]|nr:helix-turn-helix domain-containing protein [Gluconobacter oxydans]WKE48117.1 helix-turn-helix domain-containing protein [Gluconobacter oxydans]
MSRSTIYRALHAGRFKAVKCGRLTRICVASVEQYFASLPAMGAA